MKKRILIADDDPDMREMLLALAQREGWEVVLAEDGRKALLAYHLALDEEKPFNMLLLDAAMPRLNGFAVGINVRNLEKYGEDVPRACHVYFTAHDSLIKPSTLRQQADADFFILKPGDGGELIKVLKWEPDMIR